jgi:von Willebrand factor type A domain
LSLLLDRMRGRQTADIVFCLDASASMGPYFDALRQHIKSFVNGLESGGQISWDIRLDFLAYCAGESSRTVVFEFRSLFQKNMGKLLRSIYGGPDQGDGGRFFTTDLDEFRRGLDTVEINGDEASLVALDTALDYPWRESASCHRVIILMTDEALETGVYVRRQVSEIPKLIEKIHALRVKLFLIGPPSNAFDEICAADRSEYQVTQNAHDGLKNANFAEILNEIGKSVSVSTIQAPPTTATIRKAIFSQDRWVATQIGTTGS